MNLITTNPTFVNYFIILRTLNVHVFTKLSENGKVNKTKNEVTDS